MCDAPLFTGYTRDGGFATAVIADARFAFPLGESGDDVSLAPLLCAGLIGWRSLDIARNSSTAASVATIHTASGAIRSPHVARVAISITSAYDEAMNQAPGRELHKCGRSRAT